MNSPPNQEFLRFAHAHLPTRAEVAIYPVLAGAPDRWWTVSEVARAADVSGEDADHALRRFAAAGIAEHVLADASHRYRWDPDMAYLREGVTPAHAFVDPICGMPVPAEAPHVATDGDQQVRFCSLPCMVKWQSDRRRPSRWR